MFGERATTFDLRFSKFLSIARTRTRVMLDMYNAFNSNVAVREDYVVVPGGRDNYLVPGTILPGRLLKIGWQIDF